MLKYLFVVLVFTTFFVTRVISGPSSTNLSHRLYGSKVDSSKIGCQCIMTASTVNKTDTTDCLCYNRQDGTLNDSESCTNLQDIVFTFCTEVTDTNKAWQACLKSHCPSSKKKHPF